jgi:hypothetical protein
MNALERAKTTRARVKVEPIAMTHVLPPHPQLDIRSSEAQNPIQQMDQQQSHIDPQQPPQAQAQPPPPPGRKRKKAENGEPSTPAEPRRLRRSHEACARCRSKKIKVSTQASAVIFFPPMRTSWQVPSVNTAGNFLALPLVLPPRLSLSALQCDSKHPRCTACATAGTPCHQEDRHRQTLTLRGHTEHLEQKLAQCDAILKRRIPGFDWRTWTIYSSREGVEVEPMYRLLFPPPSNLPVQSVHFFFLRFVLTFSQS